MKPFYKSTLSLVLILISLTASAQKSDSLRIQQKLDSLIIMQKQLQAMQQDIYQATVYVDPLANKKFGIEINPTSLFAGNFTGGIQLFSIDRKAEISIPVSYYVPITFWGENKGLYDLNVDLQYRRFIGEHQNGFWFGGGFRFTYAKENVGKAAYQQSEYNSYYYTNYVPETNTYFGVMAGIGYRYYTQSGFYWGVSCSLGKYMNVESKKDSETGYSNNVDLGPQRSDIFYDLEFLKIGFVF